MQRWTLRSPGSRSCRLGQKKSAPGTGRRLRSHLCCPLLGTPPSPTRVDACAARRAEHLGGCGVHHGDAAADFQRQGVEALRHLSLVAGAPADEVEVGGALSAAAHRHRLLLQAAHHPPKPRQLVALLRAEAKAVPLTPDAESPSNAAAAHRA